MSDADRKSTSAVPRSVAMRAPGQRATGLLFVSAVTLTGCTRGGSNGKGTVMRPHEPIRVHEDVLVFVCDRPFRAPSSGQWNADQVLAHLVAIDRMVAAAAAELLSGGVPVVDNRAARSVTYLDAIMATTGRRDDLLQTLDQAGREVALLADQLDDTRHPSRDERADNRRRRWCRTRPAASPLLSAP